MITLSWVRKKEGWNDGIFPEQRKWKMHREELTLEDGFTEKHKRSGLEKQLLIASLHKGSALQNEHRIVRPVVGFVNYIVIIIVRAMNKRSSVSFALPINDYIQVVTSR